MRFFAMSILCLLLSATVCGSHSAAQVQPKPSAKQRVLHFFARWAAPCKKQFAELEVLKSRFSKQIDVIDIDVDDPNNRPLVEKYDVCPVPTLLVLNCDESVSDYLIGADDHLEARLAALIQP